jgi:hypothetical protein
MRFQNTLGIVLSVDIMILHPDMPMHPAFSADYTMKRRLRGELELLKIENRLTHYNLGEDVANLRLGL